MNGLPDLVIFDCDGVLVDSEIIANGVMAECLNEAGVMLNLEQTMAFGVGKSATAVADAVKTEFGVTLPANFFEDMGVRIIAAYPGKLRPMDGILELLAALKLKRCVASNSPLARVQHALTTTGLMPHLEPHIYTSTMVARGKPAPDLLLYAAKQHGVSPERCLVIEDSLSGVVAQHRRRAFRSSGFCLEAVIAVPVTLTPCVMPVASRCSSGWVKSRLFFA